MSIKTFKKAANDNPSYYLDDYNSITGIVEIGPGYETFHVLPEG